MTTTLATVSAASKFRSYATSPSQHPIHDGSLASLSDVIDHYSHVIADNPKLDARLRNPDNSPKKMNFTPHEKEALIAFLKTLTDESYLNDVRFSDPFKR